MAFKYKYKGNGTVALYVDTERYELSKVNPHLKDEIVLSIRLTEEELKRIGVLEFVEETEEEKRIKSKIKKVI